MDTHVLILLIFVCTLYVGTQVRVFWLNKKDIFNGIHTKISLAYFFSIYDDQTTYMILLFILISFICNTSDIPGCNENL